MSGVLFRRLVYFAQDDMPIVGWISGVNTSFSNPKLNNYIEIFTLHL